MQPTIRDVAKLAGVSDTTVSLAFKPKSRISKATRQKVLDAAQQLNYVANEAARNLRQGGLDILAILVNDLTNPFYASMVRTVETTAEAEGYQVLVMESQWNGARELEAINRILQARVQGVIICQSEQGSDQGLDLLSQYKVPYVALDTFPLDYKGSYVANDMADAGKMAAEHLCDCGCKNLAVAMPITRQRGRKCFSSFARLKEGFAKVAKSRSLRFSQSSVFNAGLTIEEGLDVLPRILQKSSKVDGVLCGNDLCALGVMEAMDKKGLKVGHDIAVMGIDDLPVSRLARISLTSIQQPYEAVSKLATEAIIKSVDSGKAVSIHKMLSPTLIARDSTKRRNNK